MNTPRCSIDHSAVTVLTSPFVGSVTTKSSGTTLARLLENLGSKRVLKGLGLFFLVLIAISAILGMRYGFFTEFV
jgi:hypothetical protein